MSPMAVFDFSGSNMTARLKAVFPGYTVDDVVKSTGFDVELSDSFSEIAPPTEEELQILRKEIDTKGILRQEAE